MLGKVNTVFFITFITGKMYQIWQHGLKLPKGELKGLLNFAFERVKHVYRIICSEYSFKKGSFC